MGPLARAAEACAAASSFWCSLAAGVGAGAGGGAGAGVETADGRVGSEAWGRCCAWGAWGLGATLVETALGPVTVGRTAWLYSVRGGAVCVSVDAGFCPIAVAAAGGRAPCVCVRAGGLFSMRLAPETEPNAGPLFCVLESSRVVVFCA